MPHAAQKSTAGSSIYNKSLFQTAQNNRTARRGRCGLRTRTPDSCGPRDGPALATDYAGTGVPINCFFNHSVVDDFGRTIGYPMPRAITACEQMPSARETEKSTV